MNIDKTYLTFVKEIKQRITSAQYDALRKVNKELITLYWDIGKSIVNRQKEYNWGKSIVENLSKDLQIAFPGIKGFSARNIWQMRTFYLTYSDSEKLQPLAAEISWTNNVIIFSQCKDSLQQEFYMRITKKFGWTKAVLTHQIDGNAYEKYLLNQTNFDSAVPEKYRNQAKLAVKDSYSFDFLELQEKHSERELEKALINQVKEFLTELGGYFTFIGSQYHLEVDGKEFFIDLLLYHRALKSLVAVELKIGDFKPEYVGKMQFYLAALDDKVKLSEENPSIGIIICRNKQHTIVEYTLQDSYKPIGVSTYSVKQELPEEVRQFLPDIEQIENRLAKLDDIDEESP